MERFAVITPSRGDRPDFIKHCMNQIKRFTIQPDEVIHVNYPPIDEGFDLVERVFHGVQFAKAKGIDLVFILEEDDYYPANYFERFGDCKADFFGDDMTYYYNIKSRAFSSFPHPGRASLFTTGFRISALKGFQWTGDVFLDIRLWKWIQDIKGKTRFVNTGAIGVKHNQGLCGGKGHTMKLKNADPTMNWLKGRVDRDSYLFYCEMSRKLWQEELQKSN